PLLYLKGISTGDMLPALESLLGKDAKGLSANSICRLKERWYAEYEQWRKRDLGRRRYVYVWADSVYCHVRMDDKLCLLVIIGVDDTGRKEVLGFWKAVAKCWSQTAQQRCWVHKTANVLNKVPKSVQPRMKEALQDIWMAET
ncbi:IS256 family transposase, partial [Vibrio owensii]|uniref:IS256 family transposase n=1 Tax=Vibrio owensii TaxID=696485 RepID=UPI00036A5544